VGELPGEPPHSGAPWRAMAGSGRATELPAIRRSAHRRPTEDGFFFWSFLYLVLGLFIVFSFQNLLIHFCSHIVPVKFILPKVCL
jgi:hypothetical protein